MAGILTLGLAGIGLITVLSLVKPAVRFLTIHFLRVRSPLRRYKRAGPEPFWALITGASAGIGFGTAKALVQEGFGVILLGHLDWELAQAAEEIRKQHPGKTVNVKTIVMDARKASIKEMEEMVAGLAGLKISILMNNVGGNPVSGKPFRSLDTYSLEDVDSCVDMNARFVGSGRHRDTVENLDGG
jgi:17beta-estradiol 17-dehydrogenase / very-long-chain 3-oxoacyl-CoA reductase